jgi:outer membrane lipoprotein SlyB
MLEAPAVMTLNLFFRVAALAMAFSLAACAAPGGASDMSIRQGRIEQITPTTIVTLHHTGVDAVLGGLAGVASAV